MIHETIVVILMTQSAYRKIKFVAPHVTKANIIVS